MQARPTSSTGVLGAGNTQLPLLAGRPAGSSAPFTPNALTLARVHRARQSRHLSDLGKSVYPLSPAFAVDVHWARTAFGSGQSVAWADGSYLVTFGSGTLSGYRHVFAHGPVAPFCHASVTVTCNSAAGTTNAVAVGLFNAAATQWLVAKFDRRVGTHGTVSIEYNTGSGAASLASYALTAAPADESVLEFNLTGPVLAAHFAGRLILARRVSAQFEVRSGSVLSALRYGFYAQSDGSGNTARLTGDVKTGYFGCTGLTDFRPVRDVWGNTYQDPHGLVYLTVDVHGFGRSATPTANAIDNWESQHAGVWSLDPRTGEFREVSKLFPTYSDNVYPRYTPTYTVPVPGGTGSVAGGTDFALKFDPRSGTFVFTNLVPLEPGVPFFVYHGSTQTNLMRGVNAGFTCSPLPTWSTGDASTETNNLNADWWEDASGVVRLAVSQQGTGRPTLHRGTGATPAAALASLVRVATNSAHGYQEGCCVLRVGDKVYPMFTGGRAYDPAGDALTNLGTFAVSDPPAQSGADTWPTVFEYRQNGRTEFYGLLFQNDDYYQTYLTADVSIGANVIAWTSGTPVLYRAGQTVSGYQSPLVNYGI